VVAGACRPVVPKTDHQGVPSSVCGSWPARASPSEKNNPSSGEGAGAVAGRNVVLGGTSTKPS
jgi:hypothetical protein